MKNDHHIPEYKYVERAEVLQGLERYEEAAAFYVKAVNKGLGDGYLWGEAAACFYNAEQYEKARQAVEHALSLDAEHVDALNVLALLEMKAENYPEAEQILLEALELDGGNLQSQIYLMSLYVDTDRIEWAEEMLSLALEEWPNNKLLLQLRIVILLKKNDLQHLSEEVNAYLSEDPTQEDMIAYKALIDFERGRFKEAEELAMQVLAMNPMNEVAKAVLLLYHKNNNWLLRFFVGRAFNTYIIEWTWWRVVLFVVFLKAVFLWGGFFILYMLITWFGGVAYNSVIRFSPKMQLLLIGDQIKQSNFFLGTLAFIGLMIGTYQFLESPIFIKAIFSAILALFVGISYFEVRKNKKKANYFKISTTFLFLLTLLAWQGEEMIVVFVTMILLVLHGLLFTFRIIGE